MGFIRFTVFISNLFSYSNSNFEYCMRKSGFGYSHAISISGCI